jgi:hypothetical protein
MIASFKIRTLLPEKEALDLLLKVKLTSDAPRQGAHLSRDKKNKKRPKQALEP